MIHTQHELSPQFMIHVVDIYIYLSLSPVRSYCCRNEYLLVIIWSTTNPDVPYFIYFLPIPTESGPLILMGKFNSCILFFY